MPLRTRSQSSKATPRDEDESVASPAAGRTTMPASSAHGDSPSSSRHGESRLPPETQQDVSVSSASGSKARTTERQDIEYSRHSSSRSARWHPPPGREERPIPPSAREEQQRDSWHHHEAQAAGYHRHYRPQHAGYQMHSPAYRQSSEGRPSSMTYPRETGRGLPTGAKSRDPYAMGELDLSGARDDDFGPDVADCLNLGSFGEESPPRESPPDDEKPRASRHSQERSSSQQSPHPGQHSAMHPAYGAPGYPPPPHGYSRSPRPPAHQYPPYYPPPPSEHHHPYGPPPGTSSHHMPRSHPGYAGYPPPPPGGYHPYYHPYSSPPEGAPHWSPGHEQPYPPPYMQPPPPEEDDRERQEKRLTPPPRESPSQREEIHRAEQAAVHGRHQRTPEHESGRGEPGPPFRSPFRSPPRSVSKRKSPLFQPSPNISTYGSFGMMDTPGGGPLAAEFSPMGPSFAAFGEETATREPFDPKLAIKRSYSGESTGGPIIQQRPPVGGSPFSKFMVEFSPFASGIQGVPRSPVRTDRRSLHPSAQPVTEPPPKGAGGDRPSMPHQSQSVPPERRHVLASPMVPPSSAKPRKLWQESYGASPGPVRLELGDVGTRSSETRKSLEAINSKMRAESGHPPPSSTRYPPQYGHPPLHFHPEMRTPIKTGAQSSPGEREPPGSRYVDSATKQPPRYSSAAKPGERKPPPSAGKENNKAPVVQRRNPCNCKKSKCLKLYCECFAAELYCDGCNCSQCQNTPEFEQIRSKAIKDTRAKNPNAFKPRISVRGVAVGASPQSGHNMGCRCRKSACLKKYCECFQAVVMCGNKCKCVDCLNFAGSQALIDKRRKMKDHRGADFAMRVADETWKGHPPSRKPTVAAHRMSGMPSPAPGVRPPHLPLPPMMQHHPSPSGGHPGHGHRPPYMPPPMMVGPHMGPMGYSPVPSVTPGYGHPLPPPREPMHYPHHMHGVPRPPPPNIKPSNITPRTPAVRVRVDPTSSRKRRKISPGSPEPSFDYFGAMPPQPKSIMLAIFSYLSNDDLYNAGLVCKRWSRLAIDGELWKFQS